MCSSSFCRRGVASSDAAGCGRVIPWGIAMEVAGGAPAVGTLLRWNNENMTTPE
jgi:hypothetical protein